MPNTLGGHFAGYRFYLVKGKPAFTYNLLTLETFRREAETSRPKDANS